MGLLEAFAAAFFRTFGVTQPSDRARRGAAWFLLGMLLLTLLGLGAATFVLLRLF
jgi:Tfp pilus assembly protein PilX